jgi:diguanylate cyclase (GGDEF)-like protein
MTIFLSQLGLNGLIACVAFLLGAGAYRQTELAAGVPVVLPVAILAAAAAAAWLARQRRAALGREQAARRAAEEQVNHLVRHDALTGLPNRGVLLERLETALAGVRRGDRPAAVLCVNLTDFKAINETLGYAAGDLLLRHTSARLLGALRETDTLARMGADEFAIVQSGLEGPRGAAALCDRLLAALDEPFDLLGHGVQVAASIGVALCPAAGGDPDEVLKQAGLALRRAKADGGKAFRFFEEAMDAELRQRRALQHDLHHALERGQLEVHYQPQIDLASRAMIGLEALLRWHHPERGRVPPDTFIPLAEDSKLILPIGAWVLEQACAQTVRWQQAGAADLRISVNLSPVQFRQPDLAGLVDQTLRRTGLAPAHLELEITERVLMEDTEANLATLHRLKQLGVKVSIDDFGVGHSSLSYLRRFPFDELKLDRSFVGSLDRDPSAVAIVRATLSLSHSLGLDAVAEGVESADQLALLDAEGCRVAQGYYFSPPVHPREIDAMVQASVDALTGSSEQDSRTA